MRYQQYDAVTGEKTDEWSTEEPAALVVDTVVAAQVDTAGLTSAVAAAQTATTIAAVRGAVLKLAAAITPGEP